MERLVPNRLNGPIDSAYAQGLIDVCGATFVC
jgi:hypothetical protein